MSQEANNDLPAPESNPGDTDATPIPAVNLGDTVRASWNFSKHQLVANIAHCSPEGKQALVAAFMWCIDPMHPVHQKDFATRVGYSHNTVWKIFQGKYEGPDKTRLDVPKKLIESIRSFLKLEGERFTGGRTDFIETPTYKRISTICELARESQTPAFIIGPSHCGKTWGLRHHVSANNHGRSVYCRIPAASGVTGILRVIAVAVGVSDKNNEVNLRRYIKRSITPDMLVVLDEVHELSYTYQKSSFFKALEVIREIYDETRCGMVLCGTRLLMEKLEGAKNAELEQLFNRGTHRLNLGNSPTPGDLKAILEANKLEFPDRTLELEVLPATKRKDAVVDQPYEVLRQLATTTRIKAITERLRYARKLATKAETDMTWVHFLMAHHMIKQNEDNPGEAWS